VKCEEESEKGVRTLGELEEWRGDGEEEVGKRKTRNQGAGVGSQEEEIVAACL
jgi:hypothetical protein